MKENSLCSLVLLLLLGLCLSCNEEIRQYSIIPQPVSISYQEGTIDLADLGGIIGPDTHQGKRIVNDLNTFLIKYYDLHLNDHKTRTGPVIRMEISKEEGKPGAYELVVSEEGINIQSSSYQGLFYGVETLKQMLPVQAVQPIALNFAKIRDEPQFGWRGMMLDVSRHFFSKDSVKKVIDILAMHKLNKFHWHLVDGIGWRIEIDQYPELTNRGAWRKVKPGLKPWEDFELSSQNVDEKVYGGYYTKEEIREIVDYAASKYIDVIPEIEMPGHSEAALLCYPELICKGTDKSGVYCAGNDKCFEFLEGILNEVIELFPYEYIHIGGDEVGKETWLNCQRCRQRMADHSLNNGEELQSYFIKRIEKFIHGKGKKLIGWDEILEGGLPERATVMSWRGMTGGIEAVHQGHEVVMSPGSPCYFDHCQGKSEYEPPSWGGYNNLLKVYNFDPVPGSLPDGQKQLILGAQANLWTEQIKTQSHLEYMMLPRLAGLAEALWTNRESKQQGRFIQNMDQQFDRYQMLNFNYAESAMTPDYQVKFIEDQQQFELSLFNELSMYDIRYTLDGKKPSPESPLYTKVIRFDKPIDLNAQCFRRNQPVGFPLIKQFSTGFGDRCQIEYNYPYNETYSGGGDRALIDQKFAIARGDDERWQGFKSTDFDVRIDLGAKEEISQVGLHFFQHIGATSVMLPTEVKIFVSADGQNFIEVLKKELPTDQSRDPIIKKIVARFDKQAIKWIKIQAKNRAILPEWHLRKGDAWIFVDEIMIK